MAAKSNDTDVPTPSNGNHGRSASTNRRQHSSYQTARAIAMLLSGLGWLTVIVGLFIALFGARSGMDPMYPQMHGINMMLGMWPGVVTALSGLVLVAIGQVTRAMVDTADNTAEIVRLMREGA